jgi:hypothetical protein
MTRGRHLSEERLVEFYLQRRGTSAADPVWGAVASAHLSACESCARQYAEMAGFLDAVREERGAEEAAAFTDARLTAQHDRILRRIDPQGRSGQILSFPASRTARRIETASSFTRRWVAAAAVAGLAAGLLLGRLVDQSSSAATARMASATTVQAPALLTSQNVPAARTAAAQTDDAFLSLDLSDLDSMAADHPVVLQSYDALTPRVQEVGVRAGR